MVLINCVPLILPVATTLAVPKLRTLALAVTPNVPVMFAPSTVATNRVVPLTLVTTLLSATEILTLDEPFESVVPIGILVNPLPSPWKKLATAKLPKVALPDEILPVATTLIVPKLRTLALPDTPNVPVTFAPSVVATILVAPLTLVTTFELITGMVTLDEPLARDVPIGILVNALPSPEKKLALARLPKLALPEVILAVTDNEPRVPTVVKLEVVIPAARVVPVKLAAFAALTTLAAAVS